MDVRGVQKIHEFSKKHNQALRPLEAWMQEVSTATWATTHDIKSRYPSADFLSGNRVVFNIKGNDYRLVVQVVFVLGVVVILQIGTHAEYDKWRL